MQIKEIRQHILCACSQHQLIIKSFVCAVESDFYSYKINALSISFVWCVCESEKQIQPSYIYVVFLFACSNKKKYISNKRSSDFYDGKPTTLYELVVLFRMHMTAVNQILCFNVMLFFPVFCFSFLL